MRVAAARLPVRSCSHATSGAAAAAPRKPTKNRIEYIRVRNAGEIDGLGIIDASVMLAVTSTNTNAPAIMIAEEGAALI